MKCFFFADISPGEHFNPIIDNLYSIFIHPDFFVKFDFEIAIDQQTKACDRTFEGVPDSECPPVPEGQPRPFLVQIVPNYAKSP